MTRRVTSDFMLVGSLPMDSTDDALHAASELFGDCCFALPDGETGERWLWVIYEAYRLWRPHPQIETVHVPKDTPPGLPDWVPGHWWDLWTFRIPADVSKIEFESWPRMDDAIASYQRFKALRDEGVIPESVRFQIGLPFPESAMGNWFREDYGRAFEIIAPAYTDLAIRELARLFDHAPAEDIAIQWDVCVEVLDLEGTILWMPPENAWARYTDFIEPLSQAVPEEALLGYHFCYGTFPQWPMYEADDMALVVRMANAAVAGAARPVDFVHLAGPTSLRSDDDAFYMPLKDLNAGDTRVFLGLAMNVDGAAGLKIRETHARRYLPDFGVANYCGFGRQPGVTPMDTLRAHRKLVDAFGS